MTNDKQNEFYQILNKARTNKLWTALSGHLVSGRLSQPCSARGEYENVRDNGFSDIEENVLNGIKYYFFMTLMAIILPFNQAGFPSLGQRTSFPAALGAAGPLKGDKT